MRVTKTALSIVVGIVCAVVAYALIGWIISFLAKIPIIGAILYFPSDASWAQIVLPAVSSVLLSAFVATQICGTAKPLMIVSIVVWLLYTGAGIYITKIFNIPSILQCVVAIISCCIGIGMKSDDSGGAK